MNLLELAQSLLTGQPIAKAEPAEDPDAPTKAPEKATPGAMSEEELAEARKEAQAGQQAQAAANPEGAEGAPGAPGAPDAPGAPEPDGDENQPGPGDGDGDEPVNKGEIMKSISFLAETYGISNEEIVKSFSGLEGDPKFGKEPVGKGIEYLEGLLNKQNDILGRIAGFLQELTAHTVKLGDQVAKSLEASEVAKSLAEKTSATVEALPKLATAKTPKAAGPEEVAKAEGGPGTEKKLTGEQLFKMALDPKCPLSPQDMARTNRASQGTFGA